MRCTLFGKQVTINEAFINFFDVTQLRDDFIKESLPEIFDLWYQNQGNIHGLADTYLVAVNVIKDNLADSLFDVYDRINIQRLNKSDYCKNVLSMQKAIRAELASDDEKNPDYIAKILKEACNLRRSEQQTMYQSRRLRTLLFDGFKTTSNEMFSAHILMVDDICDKLGRDNYYEVFDIDTGLDAFKVAQKVPSGQREKMLKISFEAYPANAALLRYIFQNYPNERETIEEVAERFDIEDIE